MTYDGRVKKYVREHPCKLDERVPAARTWDWFEVRWKDSPGSTWWRCEGVPDRMDADDVNGKPWRP